MHAIDAGMARRLHSRTVITRGDESQAMRRIAWTEFDAHIAEPPSTRAGKGAVDDEPRSMTPELARGFASAYLAHQHYRAVADPLVKTLATHQCGQTITTLKKAKATPSQCADAVPSSSAMPLTSSDKPHLLIHSADHARGDVCWVVRDAARGAAANNDSSHDSSHDSSEKDENGLLQNAPRHGAPNTSAPPARARGPDRRPAPSLGERPVHTPRKRLPDFRQPPRLVDQPYFL